MVISIIKCVLVNADVKQETAAIHSTRSRPDMGLFKIPEGTLQSFYDTPFEMARNDAHEDVPISS